jgi:hypothetical protein
MPFESRIGNRNVRLVPTLVTGFAATNKKDGFTLGIESEQDPPSLASLLNTKFFHVLEIRAFDAVDIGSPESGTTFCEKEDCRKDCCPDLRVDA